MLGFLILSLQVPHFPGLACYALVDTNDIDTHSSP